MAFSANRIALIPAQLLFSDEQITEVFNDRTGKLMNYSATVKGVKLSDTGLLSLCIQIVEVLRGDH